MLDKKKKVLYISNVDIDGPFLPGVIHKIVGQEKAFKNAGFEIDSLYPGDNKKITIKKNNGEKLLFTGSRGAYTKGSFFSKLIQHYQISHYGSINFSKCFDTIKNADYDVIYLRFYLPGRDLIVFLERLKKACPGIVILLEYPTLNIKNLFSNNIVRRISYAMNRKRVQRLNGLSDYLITLTKDKSLFGKPAIFMANGIAVDDIRPVEPPPYTGQIVLFGVASDCAFYHGFDKVIKGLALYKKQKQDVTALFRIISNPLSKNVDYLKGLVKELDVEDMVSFELPKTREELSAEYRKVQIGMGTLALHRINLLDNYSLKHLEYAAFGLPFIMSKGDEHFEGSPFVLTVERDEEPLDIKQVVDFYLALRKMYPSYPQEFRKSVEGHITWEAQLKNVFAIINKA